MRGFLLSTAYAWLKYRIKDVLGAVIMGVEHTLAL